MNHSQGQVLLSNARLAVERKELGSAAELLATLRRLRPAVARLGPAEGGGVSD